jgi:hypothetical protein
VTSDPAAPEYNRGVNAPALGAAIAASVLVVAHGAIGHGWHGAQLRGVELKPTRIVGDADAAHRFFHVTWHLVTVFFIATAAAMFAIAFGAVAAPPIVPRFIAGTYVAVLGVCAIYFAPRPRALLRPIPSIAGASMIALVICAWLAG